MVCQHRHLKGNKNQSKNENAEHISRHRCLQSIRNVIAVTRLLLSTVFESSLSPRNRRCGWKRRFAIKPEYQQLWWHRWSCRRSRRRRRGTPGALRLSTGDIRCRSIAAASSIAENDDAGSAHQRNILLAVKDVGDRW